MLEKGKLRERVKKGIVSANEARNALLELQKSGEYVNESILKWLANYNRKVMPTEPKKKRRRRKKRR
jgi:hypothetical protein